MKRPNTRGGNRARANTASNAVPKPPRQASVEENEERFTDPVEVYCRLKKSTPGEETCVFKENDTTIKFVAPSDNPRVPEGTETYYKFKSVLDSSTSQKELFDEITLPLVHDLLHGKDGLLFAYGVTSSGKTYTIGGTPLEPGILPRTLDVVFNSIQNFKTNGKYVFKPDKMNGFEIQREIDAANERRREHHVQGKTPKKTASQASSNGNADGVFNIEHNRSRDPTVISDVEEDNAFSVFISYLEIYNNYIFDLLDDSTDQIKKGSVIPSRLVREDSRKRMYAHGANEVEVETIKEAIEVFRKGQKRRHIAQTALNTESSRSHSVFNIRLVQAPMDARGQDVLDDKSNMQIGQLSLVDLAGSERTGRTGNMGQRAKEAGSINQSLMTLRTCMEVLRENQKLPASQPKTMVPYRDSKITHMFRSYFEGEGRVRMIICVNGRVSDYTENIQVMRFAELSQEIQVTRAQVQALNPGFTPGRRNNYRQQLEVQQQQMALPTHDEQGSMETDTESEPAYTPMSMAFIPFQPLEVTAYGDNDVIARMIANQRQRMATLTSLFNSCDGQFRGIRGSVIEQERQLALERGAKEALQQDLDRQTRAMHDMETERVNEAKQKRLMQTKVDQLEKERQLTRAEYERDLIQKQRLEEENERMKTLIARQGNDKASRQKEKALLDKQTQLEAALLAKDTQLRMINDFMRGDAPKSTLTPSVSTPSIPSTVDGENEHAATHHHQYALRGDGRGRRTAEAEAFQQVAPTREPVRSPPRVYPRSQSQSVSPTKRAVGDVIPSSAGGAQVVFRDVETMRQRSPPEPRKRHASVPPAGDEVMTGAMSVAQRAAQFDQQCTSKATSQVLSPKKLRR